MISIAITSFNRSDLTLKSFEKVLYDQRISEVVIVDDQSEHEHFTKLYELVRHLPKVRLIQNEKNLGCYWNKRKAVESASNEWVILLDSDNQIDTSYLDAIENVSGHGDNPIKTILQPEFARPHFDFRVYSGKTFDREWVKNYLPQQTFCTMLNAMNFFVNRDEYLRVFDTTKKEPWTADSIYFNYLWLKAGNKIYVTPGMQYDHLVHDGSHYKNNVHKTGNFYNEVVEMLKQL